MRLETRYKLCPKCHRSVSITSDEQRCVNDGTPMIEACPRCQAPIGVAGAHFCANCGLEYQLTQATPVVAGAATRPLESPRLAETADQDVRQSWAGTRRGRAASILAILTIAGVAFFAWYTRNNFQNGSFVGEIAGTSLFIGLTAQGGQVFAYVCDGVRVGEWFKGSLAADSKLDLSSMSGSRLTAQIAGGVASGNLKLSQGGEYSLAMTPASGEAGLYRATRRTPNANVVAGWVVLSSGLQRGVISVNGKPMPAPPLNLKQLKVRVKGMGELEVRRAEP